MGKQAVESAHSLIPSVSGLRADGTGGVRRILENPGIDSLPAFSLRTDGECGRLLFSTMDRRMHWRLCFDAVFRLRIGAVLRLRQHLSPFEVVRQIVQSMNVGFPIRIH